MHVPFSFNCFAASCLNTLPIEPPIIPSGTYTILWESENNPIIYKPKKELIIKTGNWADKFSKKPEAIINLGNFIYLLESIYNLYLLKEKPIKVFFVLKIR